MAYIRKTYAFIGLKMVSFSGHITANTAKKRGFDTIVLSVLDASGKGRSDQRRFYSPDFAGMPESIKLTKGTK